MLTEQESWATVGAECPRRIMTLLHAAGHYLHGTSACFPGKLLCYHKDSELPRDWEPSPAQAEAWRALARSYAEELADDRG